MSAGDPGPGQTELASSPPPEAVRRAPLARRVVLVPQADLLGRTAGGTLGWPEAELVGGLSAFVSQWCPPSGVSQPTAT